MSLRSTARALPTVFRIGFSEAIAYRAEMVVWLLSTTMPFIMLLLWTAVASQGAVVSEQGREWTASTFTSYFLAAFVVRQLVSTWAAWEINWEVKQGTLSMRLLRPIHPIVSYAAGHLAAMPLRLAVATPVMVAMVVLDVEGGLPKTTEGTVLWVLSLAGGWGVAFFTNIIIGALSLFMESSIKVMEVWMATFFILSGYIFPLELIPPSLRAIADVLPFRYQMGLPVEFALGAHQGAEAWRLIAQQWAWVGALAVVALWLWSSGVKRFQAFGG